ncbi:unnamed protein product, partial [Rotaria magnacalcarata]
MTFFYTIPTQQTSRTTLPRKPLVDNHRKALDQTSRLRTSARLKQLMGPVFVKVFVDTTTMTAESILTMGDGTSNPLMNSSYSNRVPKGLPMRHKVQKQKKIRKMIVIDHDHHPMIDF